MEKERGFARVWILVGVSGSGSGDLVLAVLVVVVVLEVVFVGVAVKSMAPTFRGFPRLPIFKKKK